MTLCPQTASNVLNLSYRYGCNYKRSRCPDGGVAAGWAHLKGAMGVGILPHREPDVQCPAGMHHRTSPLGEGTESRARLRDDG